MDVFFDLLTMAFILRSFGWGGPRSASESTFTGHFFDDDLSSLGTGSASHSSESSFGLPPVDDMIEIGTPYDRNRNIQKSKWQTMTDVGNGEESMLHYCFRKATSRIPQQRWRRAQRRRNRIENRRRCMDWIASHRWELIGTGLMLMGLSIILGTIFDPEFFSFGFKLRANQGNPVPVEPSSPVSAPSSDFGYVYGNSYYPPPSPVDYSYRTPSPVDIMNAPSKQDPTSHDEAPRPSPDAIPPVSHANVETTNENQAIVETTNENQEAPLVSASIQSFLIDTLSLITAKSKLQDVDTPQGKAYKWLLEDDELGLIKEEPTLRTIKQIQQRYVLAALYFATGGGRTTTKWTACGAVPTTGAVIKNAFSIRCVFEDGMSICADRHAFLNCSPDGDEQPILPTVAAPPQVGQDVDGTGVPVDLEMDDPQYSINSNQGSQTRIANNINNKVTTASRNGNESKLTEKRWLSPINECNWFGVRCTNDDAISSLNLVHNGLVGTLIPEIAALGDLETLDLSYNDLKGELPSSWGAPMSKLRYLSLSHNAFEGSIPNAWFYALTTLETFNVGHNKLSGTLPPTLLPKWSATLKELLLSNNRFRGPIPASLSRSRGLKILDFSDNDFDGELPAEIATLRQLRYLNLSDCKFKGSIPEEIGEMTNLGKTNVGFARCSLV